MPAGTEGELGGALVPGVPVPIPSITRKDVADLEFALVNGHSAYQFYAGAGPFERTQVHAALLGHAPRGTHRL